MPIFPNLDHPDSSEDCRTLADFFVVELQIFRRGQIGLKFVGTSACRTLADFSSGPEAIIRGPWLWLLSGLTALRLDFSLDLHHVGKDACSRDSHDYSSLVWGMREPRQIVLVHRTRPTRPDTDRYHPKSPDLVADFRLNSPHTSRQVKSFWRPTIGYGYIIRVLLAKFVLLNLSAPCAMR